MYPIPCRFVIMLICIHIFKHANFPKYKYDSVGMLILSSVTCRAKNWNNTSKREWLSMMLKFFEVVV